MEKIPSGMERLLLPKLNEITGELKAIHTRIDSVEKEIVRLRSETKTAIASLRNEMLTKFEAVDAKFEKVDARFDSLEVRMPALEKMVEFEARLLEVEKKLAAV